MAGDITRTGERSSECVGGEWTEGEPDHTLKRNSTTSPSAMT